MAEIEVGDVVMARGTTGRYHAIVTGVRLGRLVVERLDGRGTGPLSVRDVLSVFKNVGPPTAADGAGPRTERLRPTGQLRLDLPREPEA